jgi:hypothetical protein
MESGRFLLSLEQITQLPKVCLVERSEEEESAHDFVVGKTGVPNGSSRRKLVSRVELSQLNAGWLAVGGGGGG